VPIANCFVRGGVATGAGVEGLTGLWAEESGIGDEHMTVNVLVGTGQSGAAYAILAFLYLPSLWKLEDVRRLQVGLARALARGFALDPADVQVITSIVESGHVVENGETQEW
jgi:hypothetical protein